MLVQVTQKHITMGKSVSNECPIALALIDVGAIEVSVGGGAIWVRFKDEDKEVKYLNDLSVLNFIVMFDSAKLVNPNPIKLLLEDGQAKVIKE
jgi:hypothetical protein